MSVKGSATRRAPSARARVGGVAVEGAPDDAARGGVAQPAAEQPGDHDDRVAVDAVMLRRGVVEQRQVGLGFRARRRASVAVAPSSSARRDAAVFMCVSGVCCGFAGLAPPVTFLRIQGAVAPWWASARGKAPRPYRAALRMFHAMMIPGIASTSEMRGVIADGRYHCP